EQKCDDAHIAWWRWAAQGEVEVNDSGHTPTATYDASRGGNDAREESMIPRNGYEAFVDDEHDEGLDYRRRYQGLIGVESKVPIRDRAMLSLVYTPGVAAACMAISENPTRSYDLTCRGNTVAIVSDGSDLF